MSAHFQAKAMRSEVSRFSCSRQSPGSAFPSLWQTRNASKRPLASRGTGRSSFSSYRLAETTGEVNRDSYTGQSWKSPHHSRGSLHPTKDRLRWRISVSSLPSPPPVSPLANGIIVNSVPPFPSSFGTNRRYLYSTATPQQRPSGSETAASSFSSSSSSSSGGSSKSKSLEVEHAEFIAHNAERSKANLDQERRKSRADHDEMEAGGPQRSIPDEAMKEHGGKALMGEQSGDRTRKTMLADPSGDKRGSYVGRLSPTSSHLFKLIVPLPAVSLSAESSSSSSATSSSSDSPIETAFLLHPSQPLSHVAQLILGSLPPSSRSAQIEFRAISAPSHDSYPSSSSDSSGGMNGSAMDETPLDEGGPMLHERVEGGGKHQEVRWSGSTDLGDFIKQSTLDQSFKIVIRLPAPSLSEKSRGGIENEAVQEVEISVRIPSFASRTAYLRKRLLKLTQEIAALTDKKKSLDKEAHRGARRFAVTGLAGLVGYWGVVCKLTFFSPLGWDVMEPITYLSGLATVIGGYLFFLYHNREVSYSSILDLSVSARQGKLYADNGLDLEHWSEIVSEARKLRKEIAKIAADYDYDWRGQLDHLEDGVKVAIAIPKSSSQEDPKSATETEKKSQGSVHRAKRKEAERRGQIDVDATIEEASEEAEKTKQKERGKARSIDEDVKSGKREAEGNITGGGD